MHFSQSGLAALDASMSDFVTQGRRAGVVYGVMQGGKTVAGNAFGSRDREAGLPMTEDTVCRIFSMTRAVSSLAFLTLIETGKVRLDDEVGDYLPELRKMEVLDPEDPNGTRRFPLERAITISHLLTYTAGISYPFDWPEGVGIGLSDIISQSHDLATGIAALSRCPLITQPGSRWRYGFSSDVLGRVIEVVSGEPLDRFIRRVVLEPLGMSDTGFWAGEGASRLAKAYGPGPDQALAHLDTLYTDAYGDFRSPPRFLSAGGGLCSTVPDYLRFCRFLLDGTTHTGQHIVSPDTRAAMLTRQTSNEQGLCLWYAPDTQSYVREHAWGLGIGLVVDDLYRSVPHRGAAASWYGLMNTFFFIDPGADVAAVVMAQYAGPDEFALGNQFREKVYAALVD